MQSYLEATRHASQTLIEAYMRELIELQDEASAYNEHIAQVQDLERELKKRGVPETFSDWEALATAWQGLPAEWVTLRRIQEKRLALKDSTACLCGALLQIAKQGLSAVHGPPAHWPNLPSISGVAKSSIIRHGRNQAVHFEEGVTQQTQTFFAQLSVTFGSQFDLMQHPAESLSREIIDLLHWHTLNEYVTDMLAMA